jgi:hypothetical protein
MKKRLIGFAFGTLSVVVVGAWGAFLLWGALQLATRI